MKHVARISRIISSGLDAQLRVHRDRDTGIAESLRSRKVPRAIPCWWASVAADGRA